LAEGNKAEGNKAEGNKAEGNKAEGNKAEGSWNDRVLQFASARQAEMPFETISPEALQGGLSK